MKYLKIKYLKNETWIKKPLKPFFSRPENWSLTLAFIVRNLLNKYEINILAFAYLLTYLFL